MGFGGVTEKKKALKGWHLKKIREKGGSPKILPLLEGGSWEKNLVTGGVMQLSNDTSKNSTSPPYLVKNERSLRVLRAQHQETQNYAKRPDWSPLGVTNSLSHAQIVSFRG